MASRTLVDLVLVIESHIFQANSPIVSRCQALGHSLVTVLSNTGDKMARKVESVNGKVSYRADRTAEQNPIPQNKESTN